MCCSWTTKADLSCWNFYGRSAFVRMSTTCSLDLQYLSYTSSSSITSRMKWYYCNVPCPAMETWIFLPLQLLICCHKTALLLLLVFSPKSSKTLLSHITCEVAIEDDIAPASAQDWATDCCLLDNHENTLDPRENTYLEVFFISSTLLPRSLSQ